MGLDLSKLETLAHRGFEDAEQAANKDSLIERGFVVVEDEKTPFEAPAEKDTVSSTLTLQSPAERRLQPFKSTYGADYRRFYRLACNFHEKYTPPRLSCEYWDSAAADMISIARENDNNEFLMGLLLAIFQELEREYIALRDNQPPR